MLTIVYGIKSSPDLVSVCSLNPKALGFSYEDFGPGQLANLLEMVPSNISTFVTIHADQEQELENKIQNLKCQVIHLGTHPDKLFPQTIYRVKKRFPNFKYAQVIPVIDRFSLDIAYRYENVVDFLFLDSFNIHSRQLGVTGETHDWLISAEIVKQSKIPVILAGGLGPENVRDAINIVHPYGVATKTRTDLSDGSAKDLDKVRSFLSQSHINSI